MSTSEKLTAAFSAGKGVKLSAKDVRRVFIQIEHMERQSLMQALTLDRVVTQLVGTPSTALH